MIELAVIIAGVVLSLLGFALLLSAIAEGSTRGASPIVATLIGAGLMIAGAVLMVAQ